MRPPTGEYRIQHYFDKVMGAYNMSHPAVSHQGNFHGNKKENEVKREKERIRVGGSLTPSTLEIPPKKRKNIEKKNACFH